MPRITGTCSSNYPTACREHTASAISLNEIEPIKWSIAVAEYPPCSVPILLTCIYRFYTREHSAASWGN